jgi:putative ABC transport system substrate-binding protein
MAYHVVDSDLHRRAAAYVNRILRGAKPSDVPAQQPVGFIWSSTRLPKALGIEIPATLLALADGVIE